MKFLKSSFLYFPKYERKNRVYYLLLFFALIRPIGFIFQSPEVDGIGAATCISPLPTVFSKPGGIEAFTSRVYIVYPTQTEVDSIEITPPLFLKIEASHPMRNAFSLMLGYFALFPEKTAQDILHYFFYKTDIPKKMGVPYKKSYELINKNKNQEWKIKVYENR